jgi:hypothetical protein
MRKKKMGKKQKVICRKKYCEKIMKEMQERLTPGRF